MTIRVAIEHISPDGGINCLNEYYCPNESLTGAYFESFQRKNSAKNEITVSDLYAVSTHAVDVPTKAGLAILSSAATEVSDLLSQITTKEISALSEEEFDEQLGQDSAAMKLWRLILSYRGVGPTRASKITARKRPHLIPIIDSVINRVANHKKSFNDWRLWWEALRVDSYLEGRANELRQAIDKPELSTLRALDVMLWMSGTRGIHKQ